MGSNFIDRGVCRWYKEAFSETGSSVAEDITPAEIRAELDRILNSQLFSRAANVSRFLSYVCEKSLQGQADEIKEYNIAVEALGRPESFNPREDPIVRVEAGLLRQRLKKYYQEEGKDNPVQIVLPKGQYVPECRPVRRKAADQAVAAAQVTPRRKFSVLTVAVTVLVLLAVAGAIRFGAVRIKEPVDVALATETFPSVRTEASAEVRILAGNLRPKYVDEIGRVWDGDDYFAGGEAMSNPTLDVLRAEDPMIWRHFRHGDFTYTVPLPPGIYQLHLYFCESTYGVDELEGGGETNRIFNVYINDDWVLKDFDIVCDAGGPKTANIRVFTDISPEEDGFLRLKFVSKKGTALLNAFEILPGQPGRMRPVRLTTRNRTLYLGNQSEWGADRFYWGGQRATRTQPIAGTDEPDLYTTERFGNFNYSIPVPPGRYTVILHFAETYFGPENKGKGGSGSRIFHVYCNGQTLLRDFDVFQQAGGANRAIRKELRGLRPNAQGKLIFTFEPVVNYASLNALEVFPE
jgi:hypothetical protein